VRYLAALCYDQGMDRRAFEHLCELARLRLGEEEIAEFERKFARLLGFVEQTQSYTPVSESARLALKERVDLRRDHPRRFEWPEDLKHDYRVPQVIDFEGGG